jgi:hypothetical protein
MADYIQDPNDPTKQVPAPGGHNLYMAQPLVSFMSVYDTAAEIVALKAVRGSMAFAIDEKKFYIYTGTGTTGWWKSAAAGVFVDHS